MLELDAYLLLVLLINAHVHLHGEYFTVVVFARVRKLNLELISALLVLHVLLIKIFDELFFDFFGFTVGEEMGQARGNVLLERSRQLIGVEQHLLDLKCLSDLQRSILCREVMAIKVREELTSFSLFSLSLRFLLLKDLILTFRHFLLYLRLRRNRTLHPRMRENLRD